MRERFLLTKYGERVTDESAAEGDVAEYWTEIDHEPATVRDVVEALRECVEVSMSPCTRDTIRRYHYARGLWARTEPVHDYRTGDWECFSVHVEMANGQDIRGRDLARLYYLAGLVKN